MTPEPTYLDVKIMGREYRVACAPDERDALIAAVELVDNKMREIAQRTRSTIAERVAVMAALNIAHEKLALEKTPAALADAEAALASSETKRRISAMGARIDAVLAAQQKLDF